MVKKIKEWEMRAGVLEVVEDAMESLRESFDISDRKLTYIEKPRIRTTGRYTGYDVRKNTLSFTQQDTRRVASRGPYYSGIVGEEIGHFYHYWINPDVCRIELPQTRRRVRRFFRTLLLTELVGYYAAFVYTSQKGRNSSLSCGDSENLYYLDKIEELDAKEFARLCDEIKERGELTSLISLLAHTLSYVNAEKIFGRYGDRKLAEIARMGMKEAEGRLPKLGYKLF